MIKLPPGSVGMPHTYTTTGLGLTVKGEPVQQQNGKEPAKPLPSGSFWSQPGGTPHTLACPGKEECVMLVQFNDGKSGFAPAKLDPKGERPKDYVEKRLADLKFVAPFPDAGDKVQITRLWGDGHAGPSGMLFKFAAGFKTALHTHTADYHAVIIKGTIMNYAPDDKSPRELGPGGTYLQPGGVPHITACKEGSECMMYSYMMGKADVIPVGGDAGSAGSAKHE